MVCISFWQILGFFQFIVFIIFNIHEMYLRMQEESELSESLKYAVVCLLVQRFKVH